MPMTLTDLKRRDAKGQFSQWIAVITTLVPFDLKLTQFSVVTRDLMDA